METWNTYSHTFTANSTRSTISMHNRIFEYWGNDTYFDDMILVDDTRDMFVDTITLSNTHQVFYDTVASTIIENESFHGFTTAGIYNDTVVTTDYDSIYHCLVSMQVNSGDDVIVPLGCNLENHAERCTLYMNDSYGDGWTGCSLTITNVLGDTILSNATINYGHSDSVTFMANGDINLYWHCGSFVSDCSFSIVGSGGNLLYNVDNLSAIGNNLITTIALPNAYYWVSDGVLLSGNEV